MTLRVLLPGGPTRGPVLALLLAATAMLAVATVRRRPPRPTASAVLTEFAALAAGPACAADAVGGGLRSVCGRLLGVDADGDGAIDCAWARAEPGPAGVPVVRWALAAGCAPGNLARGVATGRIDLPDDAASPGWLRLMAELIAPGQVSCVDVVGCPGPAPEWRWVLASAHRVVDYVASGTYGVVAPAWHPGALTAPVRTSSALAIGDAGIALRTRDEDGPDPDRLGWATVRRAILYHLPAGLPPSPRVACGDGWEVELTDGGVLAWRGDAWAWVLREVVWAQRPAPFTAATLRCAEGVVRIAANPTALVDLASGGWWTYGPSECGTEGEHLPLVFAVDLDAARPGRGRARWGWQRVTTAQLRAWLGATPDGRARLLPEERFVGAARWYEVNARVVATAPAPPAGIDAGVDAGRCAGWSLTRRPTGVVARRGADELWLSVEYALDAGAGIAAVRCDRSGQVEVIWEARDADQARPVRWQARYQLGDGARPLRRVELTHHAGDALLAQYVRTDP